MSETKKVILAALLLASTIILERFLAIRTPILSINLSFITVMMSAIILGPKWSTLIAGLADLIGALLFPSGAYFIGYTISALLRGLIYGLFLYKGTKEITNMKFIIRIVISTAIVLTFINLGLTSIWVNITSGKAVYEFITARAIKEAIMFPIQVIGIIAIERGLRPFIKKYLYE